MLFDEQKHMEVILLMLLVVSSNAIKFNITEDIAQKSIKFVSVTLNKITRGKLTLSIPSRNKTLPIVTDWKYNFPEKLFG